MSIFQRFVISCSLSVPGVVSPEAMKEIQDLVKGRDQLQHQVDRLTDVVVAGKKECEKRDAVIAVLREALENLKDDNWWFENGDAGVGGIIVRLKKYAKTALSTTPEAAVKEIEARVWEQAEQAAASVVRDCWKHAPIKRAAGAEDCWQAIHAAAVRHREGK